MIIPELRLLAATIPAIGMASPITTAMAFQELIFFPIWVITVAKRTINAILTNSVG